MYKAVNELIIREQAHTSRNNLGSWTYSYDAASNPTTETHTGHSMSYLESSRSYAYDTLNRLTNALVTDSQNWSSPALSTTTYSYDDLGNRISHSNRGATAIGHAHDKANRMTTLATVTQRYQKAGNLTVAYSADRSTSYKYSYDHLNRLTHVGKITGGSEPSWTTSDVANFKWDALGRRIEFANHVTGQTQNYYYDGENEVVSDGWAHWVHGLSYIDERVMMWTELKHIFGGISNFVQRPYYYCIDRMYDVRALVDRAGGIVERYAYDPYGLPLVRESGCRGDMNNNGTVGGLDISPFVAARNGSSWDPRADLNDDGSVDTTGDSDTAYNNKVTYWSGSPTVAQAFSDVDNPFMFQGVPHFPLDSSQSATVATLPLNHHRARFNDPVTGRWITRDPIGYVDGLNLYQFLYSKPTARLDYSGNATIAALPLAGGAAAADGPLPIGDVIGAGILAGALTYDAYLGLTKWKKKLRDEARARERERARKKRDREKLCDEIHHRYREIECAKDSACNKFMTCEELAARLAIASACVAGRQSFWHLCRHRLRAPNNYEIALMGRRAAQRNCAQLLSDCERKERLRGASQPILEKAPPIVPSANGCRR